MGFFKDVEGEGAIIIQSGVFKQVPIATRDGYLFAKINGGYVRLMADGSTSKDKTRLDYITWEGELRRDNYGRLCSSEVNGSKSLDPKKRELLLGSSE